MHTLSARGIGRLLMTMMLSGMILSPLQSQDFPFPKAKRSALTVQQKRAKAKTLMEALAELGTRHQIHFNYDSDMLEGKLVEEPAPGPLEQTLGELLSPFGLGFEKLNHETIIIFRKKEPGLGGKKISQEDEPVAGFQISGKVTDQSGAALSGVQVGVKGTARGTATDSSGHFALILPERSVLLVSYLGFGTQEIGVEGPSVLQIYLQPHAKTLEEVVVIGYGTQKREKVIGSVATLPADRMGGRPVTQLQQALTGQLPGVTITQRNGRPGAPSGAINVRGVGSFGANPAALILVDGVPVSNFNDIDPHDVESISVLKDASSAAIYGARAANGVILITTKSGAAGATKTTYNAYVGVQSPTALPEFVDSWEYATAFNEAGGGFTDEDIARFRQGSDPDRYPNTDFLGLVLSRQGLQTAHHLGVQGGSKATQFHLSLGYLFQEGVVAKNDYTRYNLRLNLSTALNAKLRLTSRLAGIQGAVNEPLAPVSQQRDLLGIIDQAARLPATFVGRFRNGDYGLGLNQNGTPLSQLASKSFSKEKSLNLYGTLRLDYQLARPLKVSVIASYVHTYGHDKQFQASQRLNATRVVGPSQLTQSTRNSQYYTWQGLAEYSETFGKSQLNVLAGYSFEENIAENMSAFRDNLPNNDLTVIDLASPNNQKAAGTGSEWALASGFGRATYSYAGKYLLEGAIRRDGSSRFPATRKYALFPSLALGYRLGQEDFIRENFSWISELKVKASRGVLGNQNIGGDYPYQNVLEVDHANLGGTNYSFGGNIGTGAARTTLVDSTLHWESARTTDVGLDFGFFQNAITGSVTYFNRYTYDILVSPGPSVSRVLGFDVSVQNSGKLENKGWEFTLNHFRKLGPVALSLHANFSIIQNKVLDLGVGNVLQPNGLVGNGSNLFVGYPLQCYYGFLADGLFVDQPDIDQWPRMDKVNPNPQPGDIRYRDISGPQGVPDGRVDFTYDRTYLGSQVPRYTFGLRAGAAYKGLDMQVLLQGIAGVQGYLTGFFGHALFNMGNVQRWQYEGRWTPERPDRHARYPRMEQITNAGTPNTVVSSFWTLNGAYLRVKNLQLGYTLPQSLLEKVQVAKLRFFVSTENLHTFSNYRQGWDPEINTGGNFYPILSQYAAGINASF